MSLDSEWSYRFCVKDLDDKAAKVNITPKARELEHLARRLGVQEIKSLCADFVVKREQNSSMIHVSGTVKGGVIQECVVSLEPVSNDIEENFHAWFSDTEQTVPFAKARREQEVKLTFGEFEILEEYEDPEPLVDGTIDLGELAVQYFSLGINAYPRTDENKQDDYENKEVASAGSPLRKNPFEALKQWKERR